MHKVKILIIEDEKDILDLVKIHLVKEGFKISFAMSGQQAIDNINADKPDLVILDLMLPDMDGIDLCRLIKHNLKTQNIPIIMLTAKNKDSDIIAGLTIGADDYITKPFNLDILTARIKTVLRRKHDILGNMSIIKIHDLEINPDTHQVISNDEFNNLNNMELQALYLLAGNPDRVFTRNQILDAVKGDNIYNLDRSIDALIVRLRKKLSPDKNYIETVWGIGYRFKE